MARRFRSLFFSSAWSAACATPYMAPPSADDSSGMDEAKDPSEADDEADGDGDDGDSPSTSDGDGDDSACASESREAKTQALDIFVLLDQSGSMTEDQDRWTPVTQALRSFVTEDSLGGLGIGLTYFPRAATVEKDPVICMLSTYSEPEVPLADLPDNATALTASLDAHLFTQAEAHDPEHWGTPTRPAVEGALAYLTGLGEAHADRRLVLLLATDGTPSKACPDNSFEQIAAILQAATMLPRPITTYVIGIGEIENLDVLAVAGGSGHGSFVVDASGSAETEQQFLAALEEIRTLSVPCEYDIPQIDSAGLGIDFGKVNVHIQAEGKNAVTVPQVPDAATCTSDLVAWYYDDPEAPTRVHLCPASCERTRRTGSKLEIVYGCRTTVILK